MSETKKNPQVQLFFGLLFSDTEIVDEVLRRLRLDYGECVLETEPVPFTQTQYYEKEMGASITRKFIATEFKIDMEELPGIKRYTNKIEKTFADKEGNRKVNIDPGYLTLSKVVLATTKDYDHRLYLKSGIFGEVTLHYKGARHSYVPREWTYPDYRERFALDFFNQLREHYKSYIDEIRLKEKKGTSEEGA